MKRNWSGFSIQEPCFDAFGDGGGGGADPGSGGGADLSGSQQEATPVVPEVDDSFEFRLKGQEKPIKLSEYRAGFQSQATRASQEAARLRQELAQHKAQQQQYEAQRQAEARQRANQGPQAPDIFAQLKELPYLDGATATNVVQNIQGQIRQRDGVLLALAQRLQQQDQVLSRLNESHVGSTFDGKINKWVKELGLPEDDAIYNMAKTLYLGYEPGPELDAEFPEILRNSVESMERVLEARRAAKVAAARKPAFVPGRGGAAGPSKPLQLDPRATAADTATALWESLQTHGT